MKIPLIPTLVAALAMSVGWLAAQDITATVAPNIGESDNFVDIPNNTGKLLHFYTDPSPSAARMARVSNNSPILWPTTGGFGPDPGKSYNRVFDGHFLRVFPKTLPANSVITIPFSYGPSEAPTFHYRITVVQSVQVTEIQPLDTSPTTATSVRWRVSFDQPVAGVSAANFAFSRTDFPATITSVVPTTAGSNLSWTVTVSTPSGLGDLGLNWVGHRNESPSVLNTFTGGYYQFWEMPFFTQQPASTVINRPGSVTLTADAVLRDNPRTLSYQWYRGTRNSPQSATLISGATGKSYTPPAFNEVGNFTYFCRATVVSPTTHADSADAVITVVDPPEIHDTSGIYDTASFKDYRRTFTIGAHGTDLVYSWYEGVAPDTSKLLATTNTGSYQTNPLTKNTSIWVRISNAGPTVVDTRTYWLRVITDFDPLVPGLSTPIGTAFPRPNLLTIRDSAGVAFGNNIAVEYRVESGAGGASATFRFSTPMAVGLSDANGQVPAPEFTANNVAGTFRLIASNSGLSTTFTCINLPTFNAATTAGLTRKVTDPAFDLIAATGAQSAGGTFSGAGVTGSSFSPATAGAGSHELTYSINGAEANFTIKVTEAPRLVVDLATDTTNNLDGKTSLREAMTHARSLGDAQTISFAPALAGQTVTLVEGWTSGYDTALVAVGTVTIDGGSGAPVTLALNSPGSSRRLFLVETDSFLTLRNLVLTGGEISATNSGGAVWNIGRLDLYRTRVTGNRSKDGGAICNLSTLNATECTFDQNTALNEGGAIFSVNASATLKNCTLAGNSAKRGGGFFFGSGATTLQHVSIAFNSATESAGGLHLGGSGVTAVNSIIAGNTAATGPDTHGSALEAASSNNLLNLSAASAGILAAADNGGGMPTVALQFGSQAVDAATVIPEITVDQRGTARPQGASPDIGAYERVPVPAIAPQFAVPGGTFDGSATVTLSTTSPSAVIRYTLDGTTPDESNGSIYAEPFSLKDSATVRAIAYGPGYTASATASAFFMVRDGLESWRNQMGLAFDSSEDDGNPSGDGVSNLLKFAFNLAAHPGDLDKANAHVLAADGDSGLPRMELDEEGRLTLTFVRRKADSRPGITYLVEASSNLATWTRLSLSGASVTSLDPVWERVTVTDSTGGACRFGRVKVLALASYANDFNSGLGAATLRGQAIWTDQAIQLTTETTGGHEGAVVLDGPVTGPWMNGFTARFTLNIGPAGRTSYADGVAFSVGDLGSGTWSESGPATAQNLTISFDTYNNGGDGSIGIRIFRNRTVMAFHPMNPFTNGATVPVEVRYDAATGVSVVFNGTPLFTDVPLSGFTLPEGGLFGFSARTGGFTERAVVDDVVITSR